MDDIIIQQKGRDHKEQILALIRGEDPVEQTKSRLTSFHERDIAEIFSELSADEREKLLSIVGIEFFSEVISFFDKAGEYISEIDAENAADILENMDADDALEVLEELDSERRSEIFELIEDREIKEDIELIDSYGEDEFGSRMSRNFIAVKRNLTIKEAMKTLIARAPENDNIYTVFAVSEDGSFFGAIELKDLIAARSDVELESIIYTNFPFVYDRDTVSENIERLRAYSENLIPVISSKTRALLGVITSNDIVELVDEERSDDYAKLAAITSEEGPDESIFSSMKKRIPWLVALLFLGLAVSSVVGLFEGVVDALPVIVSFQSLILGMAGNVGTQSLAVTVRMLSGGSGADIKHRIGTVFKEIRVAFFNGAILGGISFLTVSGYLLLFSSYGAPLVFSASGCVGIAMCFAMAISGFTGTAIPICLYRLGFDPAVASGPLITTVNDLIAVISYYGLAGALLLNL